MSYPVKGFTVVNEAEVGIVLELFCLLHVPVNIDSLISGSSAFSKSSLKIWRFFIHVLSKPSLGNFEHYHVDRAHMGSH